MKQKDGVKTPNKVKPLLHMIMYIYTMSTTTYTIILASGLGSQFIRAHGFYKNGKQATT